MHAVWGDRIQFVDVVIRQAHPGPGVRPYHTFEEKRRDAERYAREERIPWTVAVDDLDGTVHQVYGGIADPAYLIGADGRVSFYSMWTNVPELEKALGELMTQDWQGVVRGGLLRRPDMVPILTEGWPALERGLPQSYLDLELAAPGSATLSWLGYQLRPVVQPAARAVTSLPAPARVGLAIGAIGLAVFGLRALARRRG
ncbi:MAG: hypothetical protein ACK47B_00910 [Armatimonadota bacterium]